MTRQYEQEIKAPLTGALNGRLFRAFLIQVQEMKVNFGPVKSKDFACSFGPVIVTPEALADRAVGRPGVYELDMTAKVNGVERLIVPDGNGITLQGTVSKNGNPVPNQVLDLAGDHDLAMRVRVPASRPVGWNCTISMSRSAKP